MNKSRLINEFVKETDNSLLKILLDVFKSFPDNLADEQKLVLLASRVDEILKEKINEDN